MQRLAEIAYGDPRSLFSKNGRPKKPHEWDDDAAMLIGGAKEGAFGFEIKTLNPLDAIDRLAKMMGWYQPDANKSIVLPPARYDKEELLVIAKMMEGLI